MANEIFIHQQKYIKELLKKYYLDKAKTNHTPMATNVRLDENTNNINVDQTMYRGMI